MTIIPTIPFFGKRKRGQPAPAPLTLTAASYVVGTSVTLVFDRAIDIAGIDVSQFFVNDGGTSHRQYQGIGSAALVDPVSVRILLNDTGHSIGHATWMNALPENGIVGVDGGAWMGAEGLELPFP